MHSHRITPAPWLTALLFAMTSLAACEPGRIASIDAGDVHRSTTDAHVDDAAARCDASCPANSTCQLTASGSQCVCNAGFHLTAMGCAANTDPCAVVTCSGHGMCTSDGTTVTCHCDAGYSPSGTACVRDPSRPCDGIVCSGHGTCSVVSGAPVCSCDPGFHSVGADCIADAADPCAGVTCSGHGSCSAVGSTPTCTCAPGYHAAGTNCVVDTPTDPCAGVLCSGHGTCSSTSGMAVCTCEAGYRVSGLNCISSTGPDPCAGVTCDGHGTCLSDRGTAVCHCDAGYYQSTGPLACAPAAGTVCASVSCGIGGTCGASGSAFGLEAVCRCDPGYVTYGLACALESHLFCRDGGDQLVPRGTPRCAADGSSVESCYDVDHDGTLEWGPNTAFTCPGGVCNSACFDQDCTVVGCPQGGACMGELDHMHVGRCAPACDCGNCGNCGAGSSFPGLQSYCGNTPGPATTVCTAPCPGARDGCIPLPISGGGFCFTDQGCFSGAPM